MSDDGEYSVEYVDDRPETCAFLKRSGIVKITYKNGDVFEGTMDDDRRKQGQGKYVWKEKSEDGEAKDVAVFEGQYVDGVKTGLGKMTFPNGDVYHGEWRQDKMQGDGSWTYANGDIFSGQFDQGIRSGNGTYEFAADQSLLVGTWVDNTITDGKWVCKDGSTYVGRFENGKPIGRCVIKFPTGLQQDGEYVSTAVTTASGDVMTEMQFIGGPIFKVH